MCFLTWLNSALAVGGRSVNAARPPAGRRRQCGRGRALGLVVSQPFSVQPNSRLRKVTNQGFIADGWRQLNHRRLPAGHHGRVHGLGSLRPPVSGRRRGGESERPRRREHQGELQGTGHLSAHRQRGPHHEERRPSDGEDRQRREGVCPGVRERIHQLHNIGGQRALPPGEEEDHQRRRHPVRHVHAGLRHVRGAAEALPAEVPGGHEGGERDPRGVRGR